MGNSANPFGSESVGFSASRSEIPIMEDETRQEMDRKLATATPVKQSGLHPIGLGASMWGVSRNVGPERKNKDIEKEADAVGWHMNNGST